MRLRTVLCAVCLATCRAPGPAPEVHADEGPRAAGARVAVVELFTSEGCSSCPPADGVLAEIVAARRTDERAVYALAFHVDYWNDLGWRDRFSSAASTARQRLYARSFGDSGLYTPQMVVGGTEQFTGSDRSHAAQSIARALTTSGGRVPLTLRARAETADTMAVDYEAPGAPSGSVLNLALVERSAVTAVRAGENAGRELHHANVVRSFTVVPLHASAGSVTLPLTASLRGDAGELIGYVQHLSAGPGLPILGASESPLPP